MHAGPTARRTALLLAAVAASPLACGSPQRSTLSKTAGDDRDEGAGQLARASLRLATSGDEEPERFIDAPRAVRSYDLGAAGAYGGDPYGGNPYGGTTYANWTIPQWTATPPLRMPQYNVVSGLGGAIEGVVTWNGAPPATLATACGPLENPSLRVGARQGAAGVIVYIEKVAVGRATPYYARPATIGGILAKRGCALVPAAQIVAPLPGSVAIHGDDTRARVRIAHGTATPTKHDLQEGGLVQIEIKAGVTRVDTEDGKVAASWVLGLDTPYFAVTDDAGRYRIDELAPGSYELTFWHPPVAAIGADGRFTYGAPVVTRRAVRVAGTKAAQLSVALGR